MKKNSIIDQHAQHPILRRLLAKKRDVRFAAGKPFPHATREYLRERGLEAAANTVRNLNTSLNTLNRWLMLRHPALTVDQFTDNHALNFSITLFSEQGPGYAHQVLEVSRKFYDWAKAAGHARRNPFDSLPDTKVPSQARDPMSRDDYDRLLAAAAVSPRWEWWYLVQLGWHVGTRISDAVQFRRSWVDLASETVTYTPQKTKGHGTVVRVPLEPVELHPVMEELLVRPHDLSQAWTNPDPDLLFPRLAQLFVRRGSGTGGINLEFKGLVQRAGIDPKHTFHCLRHSFSSNLINGGASQIVTASMTGHKSLQTLNRYSHVSDTAKRNAQASATRQLWEGQKQ